MTDQPSLLLLITGAPATGKTTLGRRLAARLRFPYLYKDGFKEILFDTLGWKDRDWSRQLGKASTEMLFHVTEALLKAGLSLAMESNFHPELDLPRLQGIVKENSCLVYQIICTVPDAVFKARWKARAEQGLRHPGHLDNQLQAEFLERTPTPQEYALPLPGRVEVVDTAELADQEFERLVEQIQAFWANPE